MKNNHLDRVEAILGNIESETVRVLELSVTNLCSRTRWLTRFLALSLAINVGLAALAILR